jgi:hypothetical protein
VLRCAEQNIRLTHVNDDGKVGEAVVAEPLIGLLQRRLLLVNNDPKAQNTMSRGLKRKQPEPAYSDDSDNEDLDLVMEDDQSGSDQEDDQLIPALDKPKKTYINDEVLHFIMAYTRWIIFKF